MSYHSANDLLDAVKARVAALPLDTAQPAGTKLFEVVSYYQASDIGRAFADLYVNKHRVCFIVPVNFRHSNQRDRNLLLSTRTLTVDLLIGDRSLDKGSLAALVGGARNVGVIEMAERIVDDFFDTALALSDVVVEPDEGAPLLLTSDAQPDDPGRVCWIQTLQLRAGLRRCSVP